jgi:hypothetical protein
MCLIHFHNAFRFAYNKITASPIDFFSYTPTDFVATGSLASTMHTPANVEEAERRATIQKLQLAISVVTDMELRLGIAERWTKSSIEFHATQAYVQNQKFIRAIEHLEGLIVQHLFELAKANLAGIGMSHIMFAIIPSVINFIGYKMRKQISKAIIHRSAAIQTTLNEYNSLAALQDPPRQKLEYSEVASYAWLGEFALLKNSHSDILSKPWAVPGNREMALKYFKVQGAKAEIEHLNVEIRRLQAWVDYEDSHFFSVIASLNESQPLLAAKVTSLYEHHHQVNNDHRARLAAICKLDGYSGPSLAHEHRCNDDKNDQLLDADKDDSLSARFTEYLDIIA